MDKSKSVIKVGMELSAVNRKRRCFWGYRPAADMELRLKLKAGKSRTVTMIVSGYDKSLPEDYIKSLLSEHFASCGEITKVYIPEHVDSKIHHKYAFLDIAGEDAEEQALQLNASYVGGHKLLVKAMPASSRACTFTPQIAVHWSELNERAHQTPRTEVVMVEGYDTCLSEESIESALRNLFSSCGDINRVTVSRDIDGALDKIAVLHIWGEGIAEKTQELSGTDVGGWKAVVVHCSRPRDVNFHYVVGSKPRMTRA